MLDAFGNNSGFPGSSTGNYQKRPLTIPNCFQLLLVQLFDFFYHFLIIPQFSLEVNLNWYNNLMSKLTDFKKDLLKLKNPQKAQILSRFFKTGKGDYGEGDIFLGLAVPQQRQIAKKYPNLTLEDLQKLLSSKIHEHRLTALFILMAKYKKADEKEKKGNF